MCIEVSEQKVVIRHVGEKPGKMESVCEQKYMNGNAKCCFMSL